MTTTTSMSNQQLRHLARAKLARLVAEDSYALEVENLRERAPFLTMSYFKVKLLWGKYSESMCASWLIVTEETIRDFVDWLEN